MYVDLHNHTSFSYDSVNLLGDFERAHRQGKFGLLAVTDHHTVEGASRMRDLATFPVIVGQEILTNEGEIIGLFIERQVKRDLSPEETVDCIKAQGGLVYVPHPFMRHAGHALRYSALVRILPAVDIIEVHNGGMPVPWPNSAALAFARKHQIALGAGSDAHMPCEIGVAGVALPDGLNPMASPTEFLSALRAGRIHVGDKPSVLVRVWERLYLMPRRRLFPRMDKVLAGGSDSSQ